MINQCDNCKQDCKVRNKDRCIIVINCSKAEFRITKHLLDNKQTRLELCLI